MHAVKNIGSLVLAIAALPPLANTAGTRNGAAIDRLQSGSLAMSCVLVRNTGATTGAPSTQTLDVKLQDSADGSTGWADITGAALTQKTTATAGLDQLDVDLSGAKRYIRTVEVTAFSGGTTPATPNAVEVILGGGSRLPA
jgi:hypothetical protein